MRALAMLAGLWVTVLSLTDMAIAQEQDQTPRLLLTAKLLRRLQRDRDRQTIRWMDFERRVQTVPDSPERGFELALYYAVARDEQRGREAVRWALTHKNQTRQVALVLNWVEDLISPDQKHELTNLPQASAAAGTSASTAVSLRDTLFKAVNEGNTRLDSGYQRLFDDLKKSRVTRPDAVYAAAEYLITVRTIEHVDLRESEPQFFTRFPKEFLLGLRPDQVEHPDWMAHIAALALVALDPNLENSQFLQGWAMESEQMLRDGPGVAYEFLWADPYLPGIAYQNMDPWIYDSAGRLFARVNWEENACWIIISGALRDKQNCSGVTNPQTAQFGTLSLIALSEPCTTVPPRKNNQTIIVWKLKPGAQLIYQQQDSQRVTAQADSAGLWQVPNSTSGKICLASDSRRHSP